MNLTRSGEIQGIDHDSAYNILCDKYGKLEIYRELFYYSWPQTFSNTAGPFSRAGMISGQAMTAFQMECWSDGRYALIFCRGQVIQFLDHDGEIFNVDKYRYSSAWRGGM